MGNMLRAHVTAVSLKTVRPATITRGLRHLLGNLGGLGQMVRPGMKVLLKAGFSADCGKVRGCKTHLALVEAVGREVAALGGQVMIGDSPFILKGRIEDYWEQCGLAAMAQHHGFQLVSFEGSGSRAVAVDTRVFYVSKPALDADIIINLPRLKHDVWTGLHGSVANMTGVIPGFQKGRLFQRAGNPRQVAEVMVDIFSVVPPALTIIDALTPADNKPSGGFPFGLLLASTDGIAADTVASAVMGYEPSTVYTIRCAADAGLGIGWLEGIRLSGAASEAINGTRKPGRQSWFRRWWPAATRRALAPLAWVKADVNREHCTGCGTCARSCPTKALKQEGDRQAPVMNEELCLTCWMCRSSCPQQAITARYSAAAEKIFET